MKFKVGDRVLVVKEENDETYTMENLKDACETTEDDIESTTTERDRLTEHLKTMRKWKKTLYNAMDMIGGKL